MMSIYDAIPSETCVTRQGKPTCDDELTPLTKVKEVVFEPREYLGRRGVWSGDDDTGGWVYRWPPAGALLGAMNLAVGLAVLLFGSTAVGHRRDAVARRMQRIPKTPSFVPAGEGIRVRKLRCSARRIFTRICCASPIAGSTQTASHIVQNVILFALLCKWIKPTERCTGASSGGYGYGGEDGDGPQTCITQWPWMKDEDGDYEYLRRWGNTMGTVSGDCMALSMIPLPKNSLLLPALGIPFERALRFHRKLGQAAVATGLAHGLVYMGGWYSDPYGKDADGNALSGWAYMWQQCYPLCDRSAPELSKKCDDSFLPGGDNEHTWLLTSLGHHNSANFCGLVAASGFLLILLTSFSWVRRNHYELFYKTHVVAAPCAMIGMWNHFSMAKLDVAIPFLLLMLGDYALRTYRSLRGDATIISTKVFGDEGKAPFLAIEFSSSRFRVAEPGQYFFVRIPQLARLQWHPFSVSSAPEADNITIVLKDLGDWTHALCELPSAFVPDGSKLRLDGPFGRLAVPVASYDAVLLCCGGIGCTPMMSVLGSIVARSKAGGKAPREIWFVWAVREAALVEYFMPLLIEAAQLPGCRIRVHRTGQDDDSDALPADEADEAGTAVPRLLAGRPSMPEVIHDVDEACMSHFGANDRPISVCAVLACGPDALLESVKEAIAETKTKSSFEYHEETFEF